MQSSRYLVFTRGNRLSDRKDVPRHAESTHVQHGAPSTDAALGVAAEVAHFLARLTLIQIQRALQWARAGSFLTL